MRFRFGNPFRTRATVAAAVETVVATGVTMVVTVFFVAMMVVPDAIYAQAA